MKANNHKGPAVEPPPPPPSCAGRCWSPPAARAGKLHVLVILSLRLFPLPFIIRLGCDWDQSVFPVTAPSEPGHGALCRCAAELPFYKKGLLAHGSHTNTAHTHIEWRPRTHTLTTRRQTSVALLGSRGARNATLSHEFGVLGSAGPRPSAAASLGDVLEERRQSPRGYRSGQREPL